MIDHSSRCFDPALAPDMLSELLQDLRLSDVHYCRCELRAPWGVALAARPELTLHVVTEGEAWVKATFRDPVHLSAGDAVVFPHGDDHQLLGALGNTCRRVDELPLERLSENTFRLDHNGVGQRTLLVCCGVAFDDARLHPLLAVMPRILVVHGGDSASRELRTLLDVMAGEVVAQRVGAATVMTRLADVIVARILRTWIESQTDAETGWLAAMRDPGIGRSLAAFHQRPDEQWSVSALATIAHQSRSMFSKRFHETLGVTPASYVARWRMHLASTWLRADRFTVAQAAMRLGYESPASFSRAFKRILGSPPSDYRGWRDGVLASTTTSASGETVSVVSLPSSRVMVSV